MDDLLIEMKKKFNEMKREIEERAKGTHCLICKKECSSFCNSHTVPQFVLKNITENGYITQSSGLIFGETNPISNTFKGIRNTGVFRCICRDCDRDYFRNYENRENFFEKPDQIILREIALKNSLKHIAKKLLEKQIHDYSYEKFGVKAPIAEHWNSDTQENIDEFRKILKGINGKKVIEYDLIYWKVLNYMSPIAFQGKIVLHGDLNGFVINDIFTNSYKDKMQSINIAIFPIFGKTVIMMFVDKSYNKYKNFIKQFQKLDENEKLEVINYILFRYDEEYFIYKPTYEQIKNCKNLIKICNEFNLLYDGENENKGLNDLKNRLQIPNLLAPNFAIKYER